MGSPRRNRRKYDKPKDMWNLQRINSDSAIIDEFGLKNRRELWKVQTELSRLRNNIRKILSVSSKQNTLIQENILVRLSKYNMASKDSTLDSLLDLKENAFLSRRLQSVVFKRGMSKTIKQARQLIVHGYVSINGKRVNRPGYMVSSNEETKISYYKPIDVQGVPKNREEPVIKEKEATPKEEVATV